MSVRCGQWRAIGIRDTLHAERKEKWAAIGNLIAVVAIRILAARLAGFLEGIPSEKVSFILCHDGFCCR